MSSLHSLGGNKFISQSALAAVLKDLSQREEFPTAISRGSVKRSREKAVDILTPYGPLLTSVEVEAQLEEPESGKTTIRKQTLHCVQPAALLWYLARTSVEFARLLQSTFEQSPCSPMEHWKLIFYTDDVGAGNPLRHLQARKTTVAYWTFQQFGMDCLGSTRFWFLCCLCRTDTVRTLVGKMGAFAKTCLRLFKPFEAGVQLQLVLGQAEPVRQMCFASLKVILGDEAALKDCMEFKGASATLLCPLCRNVLSSNSSLLEFDTSGTMVSATCTDWSQIELHTDESIREVLNFLKEKKDTCNQSQFKKVQQLCGFNWEPDGLLNCPELAIPPMSVLMYDWMHIFFVGGLWNVEMGLLVEALGSVGYKQSDLHKELQLWKWPSSLSSRGVTGQKTFVKKQSGDVRCSASKGLSLYSVIRFILNEKLKEGKMDGIEAAVQSYFRLARVVDLLQGLKSGKTKASELENGVIAHLRAFLYAYGTSRWIPKHHYSFHLGRLLNRHKGLIACFALERKHKDVKRYASCNTNTWASFDRSVLRDALVDQLEDLCTQTREPLKYGLVDPASPHPSLKQALDAGDDLEISLEVIYSPGCKCCAGDVVLLNCPEGAIVAKVLFHAQEGNHAWSCVSNLKHVGPNTFQETPGARNTLVDTSSVRDVCVFSFKEGQFVIAPLTTW